MNFVKITAQNVFRNESIVKMIITTQSRSLQTSRYPLLYSGSIKPKGSSDVIRLYDQNGKVIGHKSKQEAETIAKNNGFTLVAMEIVGKPKFLEFQMKPRHEAHSVDDYEGDQSNDAQSNLDKETKKETKETKKTVRDIKRMTFETSIASGDLKVKVDTMNSWISKGKEVHLTVVGTNNVPIETFSNQLTEMFVKETRFLIKKQKGRNLKLIMDKKVISGAIDSTESSEDDPSPQKKSKYQDDFLIDPNLLSNEAELEKVLKTKKIK